ncbi:hypothetical protein CSUI_010404 [Cystoisospora suis]|uniref:Transmembrane protein n=1 Tax=Cystoisospora suis TaxID=483139 RepID=A0A2C6KHB4_9APIC|nr:hypothetical protein CSUI_010404 [Cystoisospora suis]
MDKKDLSIFVSFLLFLLVDTPAYRFLSMDVGEERKELSKHLGHEEGIHISIYHSFMLSFFLSSLSLFLSRLKE